MSIVSRPTIEERRDSKKLLQDIVNFTVVNRDQGVLNRIADLVQSIKDRRFAAEDPYQVRQILTRSIDKAFSNLTDKDFDDLVDYFYSLGVKVNDIRYDGSTPMKDYISKYTRSNGYRYGNVMDHFIKFCKKNSIGMFKSGEFDKFRAVYNRFISDPDGKAIADVVKKDVKRFFDEYLQYSK